MKNFAFTMAEILISLTIIGVIAAITLPALQANINEKTWATQKKALYSRMSQALSMLPSLNGYGVYEGTWSDDVVDVSKDTAAQAFVTDGLATVLNINNICSIPLGTNDSALRHKELAKCGIPDNITVMETNSKISFPTNLAELNHTFTSTYNNQRNINTSAAAFETKNGESIAVFYNPYCQSDSISKNNSWQYIQPKMCANFIYDLNGRKGPNKVGKDIGFMTTLYPVDGELVAPIPLKGRAKNGNLSQLSAVKACRNKDKNSRLPNRNELTAMFFNTEILGIGYNITLWTNTLFTYDDTNAWLIFFKNGSEKAFDKVNSNSSYAHCVKR